MVIPNHPFVSCCESSPTAERKTSAVFELREVSAPGEALAKLTTVTLAMPGSLVKVTVLVLLLLAYLCPCKIALESHVVTHGAAIQLLNQEWQKCSKWMQMAPTNGITDPQE